MYLYRIISDLIRVTLQVFAFPSEINNSRNSGISLYADTANTVMVGIKLILTFKQHLVDFPPEMKRFHVTMHSRIHSICI